MKTKLFCFKLNKYVILLLFIIVIQLIFITIGIKRLREERNFEQIANIKQIKDIKVEQNVKNKTNLQEEDINENIKEDIHQEIQKEEYKNMPRELKGYKVIGKIEIPKIGLNTYILSETNKKSLKISVTKLYGPEINQIGNFCIAGHNYANMKMFGGIKKLEIEDEIELTDTFDRKVKYKVYQTYKTDPKDTTCLSQDTEGEKELTLITCTAGAIQRVIVKAVEAYD